jgi:hypothetical protein
MPNCVLLVLLAIMITVVAYAGLFALCWPPTRSITSDVILVLVCENREAQAPQIRGWPGPIWSVGSLDLLLTKMQPGQIALVAPDMGMDSHTVAVQVFADLNVANTLVCEDASVMCAPDLGVFCLRKTGWLESVRWPGRLDPAALRCCLLQAASAGVDCARQSHAECERLLPECRHVLVTRGRFFQSQPESVPRRVLSWLLWK